jgi:hypothetical protein
MPDVFTRHYLNDAVRQFHSLKDLADGALAQIGDERFFTVLDAEANSLAMLLKHLAGSMQARWRAFPATADDPPDRHRDREFAVEEGETKRDLIDRWEAGWQTLFEALARLTPEDMANTVDIRGQSHSMMEAINRQLTHYAYHVGQIVFLAKHFQSNAWQSLSIPRGQSEHFSTTVRKQCEG